MRRGNVFLVGFMGSGKSVVGEYLAGLLGMEFIDMDREIERREGKLIDDIFREEGEEVFREMEREYIEGVEEGSVVACGGGCLEIEGLLELMLDRGVVVWLDADLGTIVERLKWVGITGRPLLGVEEGREERIEKLYKKRRPLYEQVKLRIKVDDKGVAEVGEMVYRLLIEEWE